MAAGGSRLIASLRRQSFWASYRAVVVWFRSKHVRLRTVNSSCFRIRPEQWRIRNARIRNAEPNLVFNLIHKIRSGAVNTCRGAPVAVPNRPRRVCGFDWRIRFQRPAVARAMHRAVGCGTTNSPLGLRPRDASAGSQSSITRNESRDLRRHRQHRPRL
jgi:hypothetical protein